MKKTSLCLTVCAILATPAFAQEGNGHEGGAQKRPGHPVDHFTGIGREQDFKAAMVDERKAWELLHDKQLADAVTSFHAAIAKYPQLPAAYLGLGIACERQNNLKDAEQAYRGAIKCDTNSWRGYKRLANLLFQQQKYTEAREALGDAAALNPPRAVKAQIDKMIEAVEAARKNGHADPTNLDGGDES